MESFEECENFYHKQIIENCIKNENPTKLMDEIFRKQTLQKLNKDEIRKLSGENKIVNHLTCKK